MLQAGRVAEVYRRPASAAVARLLGIGNLCDGVVAADGTVLAGSVPLTVKTDLPIGAAVLWSVLPERVRVVPLDALPEGMSAHRAFVRDVIDLGTTVEVTVDLIGGPELRARIAEQLVSTGENCLVHIDPAAVIVWSAPSPLARSDAQRLGLLPPPQHSGTRSGSG